MPNLRAAWRQFKEDWKEAGEAIDRNEQQRARRKARTSKENPTIPPHFDLGFVVNDNGCDGSAGGDCA